MTRQALHAIVVASIVLLAGCAGGIANSPTPDTGQTDSAPATDAGTVAFYISDEENAIDDFRHLNVTVTRVGFERASADGGGWVEREVDNETVDLTELKGPNATLVDEYNVPNGTYSKVFIHVDEVNATLQNGQQVRVKLPSEKLQIQKEFTVENGSEANFVFDIAVHKAGNSGKYILKPVISESGTDVPIKSIDDAEREGELNVTVVGNVSQGEDATVEVTCNGQPVANATVTVNDEAVGTTDADGRITFEVPREEELEVDVTKADAEGELEIEFETEDEENERDDDADDEQGDDADDEQENDADDELNATFVGNVSQGENATVRVTQNGSAVENVTVIVNDETVGTTTGDGELTFEVPDTDSLTVTVQWNDAEAELEREFEDDDD
jgi:uncharacterized GH25 family protein